MVIGTIALSSRLNTAAAQSAGDVEYRPPMRGAPASRVGGGTRGSGDERPRLAVLAPDHTGLTLREQPELYWSLADFGMELSPDIEYRWFVGLVVDDRQRSNDVIASGTIQRVVANPTMRDRLEEADTRTRDRVLAEEGVWYDAIAKLSAQVREHPENTALKRDFAALLG